MRFDIAGLLQLPSLSKQFIRIGLNFFHSCADGVNLIN